MAGTLLAPQDLRHGVFISPWQNARHTLRIAFTLSWFMGPSAASHASHPPRDSTAARHSEPATRIGVHSSRELPGSNGATPSRGLGSLPPGSAGDTKPRAGIDSACLTPNSELSFRPWADRQPPLEAAHANGHPGATADRQRSDSAEQPAPGNGCKRPRDATLPSRLAGDAADAAEARCGADHSGTARDAQHARPAAQSADKPAPEAKQAKPVGKEDHLS